jgi:hypothetical protein
MTQQLLNLAQFYMIMACGGAVGNLLAMIRVGHRPEPGEPWWCIPAACAIAGLIWPVDLVWTLYSLLRGEDDEQE